jgi:hypothetical protein
VSVSIRDAAGRTAPAGEQEWKPTDAFGTFAFRLPPGRYVVTAAGGQPVDADVVDGGDVHLRLTTK